jgi:tetratricopeptide (TPR) repeat protein
MEHSGDSMSAHELEAFRQLRAREGSPGPECPQELEWILLAEGQVGEQREAELLEHAAGCDHCASRLHPALALAAPLTTAEQELVDAARAPAIVKPAPSKVVPLRWVAAMAAGVLLMSVGVWYSPQWQAFQADREVAREFSRSRPFVYRFDGLPHGPYNEQRGGQSPRLFDRARATRYSKAPWRVAILDGELESAIAQIQQALAREPGSAALQNDLAAAYAARGDRTGSAADYEAAQAMLRQVLAKDPDYPAARFNALVVASRLHRRDQVREAGSQVLRIERDPVWLAEAQMLLGPQ